ncbi:hypothetical protein L6452_43034 [Arctium lappa]|uniref:Uncharacterized protein n=1 Tax=Arctium lappa TaxID=4217 RepID=A0ACB8XJ95_ARCLA|nr:hypothetical protein L6452_43034 [Arctium lappa]
MYDVTVHRDHNFTDKYGKKYKGLRVEEYPETFMGLPVPLKNDVHSIGRNRMKLKHPENNQKIAAEDALKYRNPRAANLSQIDSQQDMYAGGEPFWPNQSQGELVSAYPYRYVDVKC